MSTSLSPGVSNGRQTWSLADLHRAADLLGQQLAAQGVRVLATLMDNSPAWVVADLAAWQAGIVHVPLPLFFTPAQVAHALQSASVDAVLAPAERASQWLLSPLCVCPVVGEDLVLLPTGHAGPSGSAWPAGTVKVTFTSGTTGQPRGVCLDGRGLHGVASGVAQALAPLEIRRHLCALPFAVLLENVAGLLAPLSAGATCVVLPLQALGWTGSSSFDVARFHAAVAQHEPHSLILLPQMLRAWVHYLRAMSLRAPGSLRFVAVGGAAVGALLIAQARAAGIPAYEGYGLSEGVSVQTLNLPGADHPGSVGRPLPHAQVRIAGDGEIEVAGRLMSGYLGEASALSDWWPTGDLGHLDDEGFLHVRGRKKNVLITSFGRNVSPEWVETMLRDEAVVAQAVVLGDGQARLVAVLWPSCDEVEDAALEGAVSRANARLPDYAQVGAWVRAQAPFTAAAGMATANGRPCRDRIDALHREALAARVPSRDPASSFFY